MIGLDKEPDDICDSVLNSASNAGIPTVMAGCWYHRPALNCYERLKREGRILREWVIGNNTAFFELDYIPDRGKARGRYCCKYYLLCFQKLYDPKNYVEVQNIYRNAEPRVNFQEE